MMRFCWVSTHTGVPANDDAEHEERMAKAMEKNQELQIERNKTHAKEVEI